MNKKRGKYHVLARMWNTFMVVSTLHFQRLNISQCFHSSFMLHFCGHNKTIKFIKISFFHDVLKRQAGNDCQCKDGIPGSKGSPGKKGEMGQRGRPG